VDVLDAFWGDFLGVFLGDLEGEEFIIEDDGGDDDDFDGDDDDDDDDFFLLELLLCFDRSP
jgi:hypothetical protein